MWAHLSFFLSSMWIKFRWRQNIAFASCIQFFFLWHNSKACRYYKIFIVHQRPYFCIETLFDFWLPSAKIQANIDLLSDSALCSEKHYNCEVDLQRWRINSIMDHIFIKEESVLLLRLPPIILQTNIIKFVQDQMWLQNW